MDTPVKYIVLTILALIVLLSFSFMIKFRRLRVSYANDPKESTATLIRRYTIYMLLVLMALIVVTAYVCIRSNIRLF